LKGKVAAHCKTRAKQREGDERNRIRTKFVNKTKWDWKHIDTQRKVTVALTCAVQVLRHVGGVGAVKEPHPNTKEGHGGGTAVVEVTGEQVPTGGVGIGEVVRLVPVGVVIGGIYVHATRRKLRQGPCVAFIRRSPERRRPGDEKREQGNARGGGGKAHEEGLGVERIFASGEVARELDGGGADAGAAKLIDVALGDLKLSGPSVFVYSGTFPLAS
jgi:hypothetical protein